MSAADEDALIRAALLEVARSGAAGTPPTVGLRFSDVERAVGDAARGAGIELAVVSTEVMSAVVRDDDDYRQQAYAYRFRLRTIEGWPGELTIVRVDGPEVYAAEGWIGRFPEMPDRYDRKERLRAAIRERMEELGSRRGFE